MLARQGKANAALDACEVDDQCLPDTAGVNLLRKALETSVLTARGYHRALKVARTIADLAGAERVALNHVAEALRYRRVGPEAL